MLHEIAQVRVTELGRKLEVFDTMGNLRIDFKPFSGEKHIDEAADFLKTLMPSIENHISQQDGKATFVDRCINFASPQQPQGHIPGWQPPPPSQPQ